MFPGERFPVLPDFGVPGGDLVYSHGMRPLGHKGLLLTSWEQLFELAPLSGAIRLERESWAGRNNPNGLYNLAVIDFRDSTVTTVVANYKQGDFAFKNFSFQLHRQARKGLWIGWRSENRFYQPYLAIAQLAEQDHRLEVVYATEDTTALTFRYGKRGRPLLVISDESSSSPFVPGMNQDEEYWEGYLDWRRKLGTGSQIRLQLGEQEGWISDGFTGEWGHAARLARFTYRHSPTGPLGKGAQLSVGYWQEQVDSTTMAIPWLEGQFVFKPRGSWQAKGGLTVYRSKTTRAAPKAEFLYNVKRWLFELRLLNLVEKRLIPAYGYSGAKERFYLRTIPLLRWNYRYSRASVAGGLFGSPPGYFLETRWGGTTSSFMALRYSRYFSADSILSPSTERLRWEMSLPFSLFKGHLKGRWRTWGTYDPRFVVGYYNSENRSLEWYSTTPTQNLWRLNWSIEVNIRTVTLAYVDLKVLQDETWNSYLTPPWKANYMIAENLTPVERFRYLTIIWEFLD